MKKLIAAVLSLALCTGLLLSCGGSGGKANGKETIRVVTFFAGSDQWAPVWKEVIADYMKDNPNVTILDESQPTAGTNDLFQTKVQTEVSAKTPPDLMLFFNGSDGEWVMDSGLFVDWTKYMQEDPAWAGELKPGPMEVGGKKGNVQYCIPFIGYYEGMLYNKGLFDQYGLAEPTSWENILASIDTLKKNGIIPIATDLGTGSGYLFECFILAQAGAAGQQKYFDPSWAPAMDAIKLLYERGAFPPDTLTMDNDGVRNLFNTGKAAIMFNGSWTVNALKDNPAMRIRATPALPGGAGGDNITVAGFGSGWYMAKAAADRSGETLKFLKWVTSPKQVTRFIAIGGSPAINCDIPEGASPIEISAVEMLNKATDVRPALTSQMVREAYVKLTQDGLPRLVEGKITALDILKEAKAINDSAR